MKHYISKHRIQSTVIRQVYFLLAVFMLSIVTGCGDDFIEQGSSTVSGDSIPLTFTASVDGTSSAVNAITRSIKSEDVPGTDYDQLHAYWKIGDQVTIVVKHGNDRITTTAKMTKIMGNDSTRAQFLAQISAEDATKIAEGDTVFAYGPTLDADGMLTINYAPRNSADEIIPFDGTVSSLAKLDPIVGTSTVGGIGDEISVTNNIRMHIPETDSKGNASFGSAYYGIKVQKIDSLFKRAEFDTVINGTTYTARYDSLVSVTTVPLKVRKLTLSIRDKETSDNGWYSYVSYDSKSGSCIWSGTYNDDSIVVQTTDDKGTYDRLYMAVPKVNNGLVATFCAQDSDGYVYTCDKIIPAEAGNYYPVTLTMHIADYVNMGDDTDWSTHNIGGTKPEDYGDYIAWGDIKPQTYYGYLWSSYRTTLINFYKQHYPSLTEEEINEEVDGYFYKFGSLYDGNYTKYNPTDQLSILESSDDAATANWGEPWRMPYADEIWRLVKTNGSAKWPHTYRTVNRTNKYGEDVKGEIVTSGKNGNSLFFPYGGQMGGYNLYNQNEGAYYWGKELYLSGGVGPDGEVPGPRTVTYENHQLASDYGNMLGDPDDATTLQGWSIGGGGTRYYGRLIRPVRATSNVAHIKM